MITHQPKANPAFNIRMVYNFKLYFIQNNNNVYIMCNIYLHIERERETVYTAYRIVCYIVLW